MRTYKPREKTSRPCRCGCGLEVVGTAKKYYLSAAHQVRAWRARRRLGPSSPATAPRQ
jgi:hypothetical protein